MNFQIFRILQMYCCTATPRHPYTWQLAIFFLSAMFPALPRVPAIQISTRSVHLASQMPLGCTCRFPAFCKRAPATDQMWGKDHRTLEAWGSIGMFNVGAFLCSHPYYPLNASDSRTTVEPNAEGKTCNDELSTSSSLWRVPLTRTLYLSARKLLGR